MLTATQLKNRRDDLLEEMRNIRRVKRGQLTQQTLTRTAADGSQQQRGPYYTLQAWKNGKNHSQRVAEEHLPAVREAVEGYQKIKQLSEEFAEVTETLTELNGPLLPAKKNFTKRREKRSTPKRKSSSKSRPDA
jgi:hypothetical protein